jgi:hypothetical protein
MDQLLNICIRKPSQWILIMGVALSIKKAIAIVDERS